jgi:hypothetical protein
MVCNIGLYGERMKIVSEFNGRPSYLKAPMRPMRPFSYGQSESFLAMQRRRTCTYRKSIHSTPNNFVPCLVDRPVKSATRA